MSEGAGSGAEGVPSGRRVRQPTPAEGPRLPEIKGFLETSFVDWPGRVASVVFLPGCNFRCPYCHNHRLVLDPKSYETLPSGDVLARLEHMHGWIDGVCVTGGEPTADPGLGRLLEALRARGCPVKLDTNGSSPDVVEALVGAGLVSAVSVDVKAPLEPIPYRRNAGQGADPAAVARTLDVLAASDVPVEVRTTVHPALLSLPELLRLARDAGRRLGSSRRLRSVGFKPQRCRVDDPLDPGLRTRPPLDAEAFDRWAGQARGVFDDALGRPGA